QIACEILRMQAVQLSDYSAMARVLGIAEVSTTETLHGWIDAWTVWKPKRNRIGLMSQKQTTMMSANSENAKNGLTFLISSDRVSMIIKNVGAIGDIIHVALNNDIICDLQGSHYGEVTPNIYAIFQRSDWWKSYKCSLSFDKASTRRYFCMQDELDGEFPLPDGWIDAWTELNPTDVGWTFDTKANQMISANQILQKRIDRFLIMSNDDRVSVNDEDTSSIAAKIRDMERRMLEGKLVLSGDDQEPLNPLNADG
ncbi:endonuclease/exonuclease/phosphatase family protein, partial [Tanacetum coccineum]